MQGIKRTEVELMAPTADALDMFWQTLQGDPTRFGTYMDTMPTRLEEFLAPIRRGEMMVWILVYDGKVAGASWLHDIMPYEDQRSSWMAVYHFPDYRGVIGPYSVRKTIKIAQNIGIPALFCGVRHSNAATLRFTEKVGWKPIGVLEDFGWFEGKLDALTIMTWDMAHAEEGWRQAEIRAQYYRTHPPVTALTAGSVL